MKQKSAKDMAFEKERAKFRSKIRDLEYQMCCKDKKLNDWIQRLLEYTEVPKEDLQKLIEHEKEIAEVTERVRTSLGVLGILGGRKEMSVRFE